MQGDSAGIYQYQPLWSSWQVDGLIGSGKFGNVYRISHEEFGQKYTSAVKKISIPNEDQFKEAASSIGNHEPPCGIISMRWFKAWSTK